MTPQEYREVERGRLALERIAAAAERRADAAERIADGLTGFRLEVERIADHVAYLAERFAGPGEDDEQPAAPEPENPPA